MLGFYDRRRNVAHFLQDSIIVLEHIRNGPTADDLTPSQTQLTSTPDALIPYREAAPSRARILEHGHFDFFRTRAGFFSALVFRCISFNSEAFRSCPQSIIRFQFATLSEWHQYLDALCAIFPNEGPEFFCNTRALGQPITERTIDKADEFWRIAQTCDWPSEDAWPMEFVDMYDTFESIKDENGLPGCGKLGMYLLTADMVGYGAVAPPRLIEVVCTVIHVNKGAIRGLVLLGYLTASPDDHTVDNVFKAFQAFVTDIRLLFAAQVGKLERDRRWDVDYIIAEHLLCKFGRMWRMNYYKYSVL